MGTISPEKSCHFFAPIATLKGILGAIPKILHKTALKNSKNFVLKNGRVIDSEKSLISLNYLINSTAQIYFIYVLSAVLLEAFAQLLKRKINKS